MECSFSNLVFVITMDDNKFLPKLSQNLLEILNDDEYYDIIIEFSKDLYVKIIRVHIIILNYRSSLFEKNFFQ